jgi:hypothetical protein
VFFVASAWSGPEPDCEPGVLCPSCGEFISDEELDDEFYEEPIVELDDEA